jgi:hypothetical protein
MLLGIVGKPWWVGFNQEDFKKIRFKIWNLEKEKKKVLEGKK